MTEDWSAVASEVEAGLKEVSSDGTGYPVLLKRPGSFTGGMSAERGAATFHDLIGMINDKDVRDGVAGAVTASQRRVMVNATGVTPQQADQIATGIKSGEQNANTKWNTIKAVKTVIPAGVPLYHIITLEN